jgi:hypothetical protein
LFPLLVAALSACSDDGPTDSTGQIELSVTPGAISLSQGTNGSVNVSLTRSTGFTEPVSLTVSGLPAGIATTVTPEELVGASATAVINTVIGTAVAPGAYTGTVHATAEGAGEATVAFQVTVTPVGTFQYLFCSEASVPVYAAFQDGNGPWQRITGTSTPEGTRFSIALTQSRGGVLFVYQDEGSIRAAPGASGYVDQLRTRHPGPTAPRERSVRAGRYRTDVLFGTRSELAEDATTNCQYTGTTGSASAIVMGVPPGSYGWVGIGGVVEIFDGAVAPNPLEFTEVPRRLVDVVAARAMPGVAPDKVLRIRNLDAENGGAFPVTIDFNGTAAIAPATALATITGSGGDLLEVYTDLVLSNGETGLWSDLAPSPSTARPWAGLPRSAMDASEFQSIIVFASPEDSPDFRLFLRYVGEITNQTVPIGSPMPAPSISPAEAEDYPRFRFQGGIPADYDKGVAIEVVGGDGEGNGFNLFASGGWLTAAGNASSYDLVMPDIDGLPGFPIAARLSVGDNAVYVSALGFNGPGVFEPFPTIGKEMKAALKGVTITVP